LRTNHLDSMRILYILCALSLAVYGETKFADFPVHAVASYAIKAEEAGLAIGLQPVEDLKDQKTYFDMELTPKGFIPVFIVIENQSKEESFLFDKSTVTYGPADSGTATPQVPSKLRDNGALATVASLAPGTEFIVMAKINHASHIQGNILKRELQSRTLSPAASTHGFLYIPAPKHGPREKIRIRVPFTRTGTQESVPLVLDLVF
jgi:hypothetical protein